MATGRRGRRALSRRIVLIRGIAALATLVLLAVAAIVVSGFDSRQTPVADASVWALQTGEGKRYARVNTNLAELDTVKDVANPSRIVQTASTVLLYTDGDGSVDTVDQSSPADVTSDAEHDSAATPAGTVDVSAAGDYVAYLTDSGQVFAGRVNAAVSDLVAVSPASGSTGSASADSYVSAAIAVTADGELFSYSAAAGGVLRYDIPTGTVDGTDALASGPRADGATITAVGDTWALLGGSGDQLWIRGLDAPVDTQLAASPVLQKPATSGDAVFVADATSLVSFSLDAGQRTVRYDDEGQDLGTPAAPQPVAATAATDAVTVADDAGSDDAGDADDVTAAWVGTTAGTLWTSGAGSTALDFGGKTLASDPAPVFQSNGSSTILNETVSGWVWTSSGSLVRSSQDWGDDDSTTTSDTTPQDDTPPLTDPRPPVAEDDAFGVRAGRLVTLPVLLNDHDPNDDVLAVVASSVEGLPASFGTVRVTNGGQEMAVQVASGARGSASFTYTVSDGTTATGLTSKRATVRLSVVAASVDHAPVFCGVRDCVQAAPAPEVQPGGTVRFDALRAWVDPDGDPLFLEDARVSAGPGTVVTTPEGQVIYQHPDPNAKGSSTVSVQLTVADSAGRTTKQTVSIRVTPNPKLAVESFAATATVGQAVTIDPTEHVSGTTGAWSVSDATAVSRAATVTVNGAANTFEVTPKRAGTVLVTFTITDAAGEKTGTVRVTAAPAAGSRLTTAPVTIFVRPQEDSVVDVFDAVSGAAGRVLLLSAVDVAPRGRQSLTVDTVSQSEFRVSGTTTNGEPGELGVIHYTVSDGTGQKGASVRGDATVYLVPAPAASAPIAVDDTAAVSTGSQVDIPVLANDLGPGGETLALNPASVRSARGDGLVFASGGALRYLAPSKPGTYRVTYQVYESDRPDLTATGAVTITVSRVVHNHAPTPSTLVGRVVAGASVSIPFDPYGVDPDGDDVTLDRVETQPTSGSAAISADGRSIVYSSVSDFSGPVSFTYRVRDAKGATGLATVRVGVLGGQAQTAPVAFTDRVSVQVGAANRVVVRPTDNDLDPTVGTVGKGLTLTSVTPDARAGTAEYRHLAGMIRSTGAAKVSLASSATTGSYDFLYEVRTDAGDETYGRIVLTVVRSDVPDYPVVQDTSLSTADRDRFATGIDVVSDKVSWTGGDVGSLALRLWNAPAGISARGTRISGTLPAETEVIPFELSGRSFSGTRVHSYGFLVIPGTDRVVLSLRANSTQTVDEGKTVTFDMRDLVSVPTGATLAVADSRVVASGQRADARCSAAGTVVTYRAATGAPWTDSCTVPVRLAGQSESSVLAVPLRVVANDPQPELHAAALSVRPGQTQAFDLTSMVTWAGANDPADLTYTVSGGGAGSFRFVLRGSTLRVTGDDDAVTGRRLSVAIGVRGHPTVESAPLVLTVGPAPAALPRGARVTAQCVETAGSSCAVTVVGGPGEVDPLPGTSLKLVSVEQPTGCTGLRTSVQGRTTVLVRWSADAPGGTCTAGFTVADAQGRRTSGDRDGSLTISFSGLPGAPASVQQVGYGDGSISLAVDPGGAANASPALRGFVVTRGGTQVARCDSAGSCPRITGLRNGAAATYTVRAVNAVGRSKGSVSVSAYAYAAPTIGSVTRTPVYDAATTSDSKGVVEVTVESSDTDIRGYTITGADGVVARTGASTTTRVVLPVGSQQVSVTPVSQFTPPGGSDDTGRSDTAGVQVAGLPSVSIGANPAVTASSITVRGLDTKANGSSRTGTVVYLAYPTAGGAGQCSVDATGRTVTWTVTGGVESSSATISGLTGNTPYTVKACYSNGFGLAQSNTVSSFTWNQPAPPSGFTYAVATSPSVQGNIVSYPITAPAPAPMAGFALRYSGADANAAGTTYSLPVGHVPDVAARYCITNAGKTYCSDPAQIASADAAHPSVYGLQFAAPTITCAPDGSATASSLPDGAAAPGDYAITLNHTDSQTDITGTTTVDTYTYTITWTGSLAGLQPFTSSATMCPSHPTAPSTPTTDPADPGTEG